MSLCLCQFLFFKGRSEYCLLQVRARNSTAYYSCDDNFIVVDKAIDYGDRGGSPIHSQALFGHKTKKQLRINSFSCTQGTDIQVNMLLYTQILLAKVLIGINQRIHLIPKANTYVRSLKHQSNNTFHYIVIKWCCNIHVRVNCTNGW